MSRNFNSTWYYCIAERWLVVVVVRGNTNLRENIFQRWNSFFWVNSCPLIPAVPRFLKLFFYAFSSPFISVFFFGRVEFPQWFHCYLRIVTNDRKASLYQFSNGWSVFFPPLLLINLSSFCDMLRPWQQEYSENQTYEVMFREQMV